MDPLWIVDVEIPKHVVLWDVGPRVALVAAIHTGELYRVPDEEYREVIEYKVLNTFFGVKLGGPASDIADRVSRAFLPTDGGNACQNGRFLADTSQEGRISEVRDVIKNLKLAKSACSFGVDAPFWYALARKVG